MCGDLPLNTLKLQAAMEVDPIKKARLNAQVYLLNEVNALFQIPLRISFHMLGFLNLVDQIQ